MAPAMANPTAPATILVVTTMAFAFPTWPAGTRPGQIVKRDFGGVYYLYVRGLNGRDESTGVYFHRPTEQDLDLRYVLTR